MEQISLTNARNGTFTVAEEDHTLANVVRFVLNQDPRVTEAGYSVPHPSLECVKIRIQTTGDPARVVFKDACEEIVRMNEHVRNVFANAVAQAQEKPNDEQKLTERSRVEIEAMDIQSN